MLCGFHFQVRSIHRAQQDTRKDGRGAPRSSSSLNLPQKCFLREHIYLDNVLEAFKIKVSKLNLVKDTRQVKAQTSTDELKTPNSPKNRFITLMKA